MKKLSFVLMLAMCFSIFATPIANAQATSFEKFQEESVVCVPVIDTEGNVLATVPMSADSVRALGIVAGATIFYCKVKTLVYSAGAWIALNPDTTQNIIMLLIEGFDRAQAFVNQQIKTAYHDGSEYTSCITVSGESCYRVSTTQWACAYSL